MSRPQPAKPQGFTANTLELREALRYGGMQAVASQQWAERSLDVAHGAGGLWAIVRRPGLGGFALCCARLPGGGRDLREARRSDDETFAFRIQSSAGEHRVGITAAMDQLPLIRVTHALKPKQSLLIDHIGRDLFPLDARDDPTGAVGRVEAAQRGHNSGLCFLRIERPQFGAILYFQDFTRLADYYEQTGTTPDGAVGGVWPELGHLTPAPSQRGSPPTDPLPAGRFWLISDATVVMSDALDGDENPSARLFVAMQAVVFNRIEKPQPEFRNWPQRAERTIGDLAKAPAIVRHYGHSYFHPYTDAEYPDAMAQSALTSALHDFGEWKGRVPKLAEDALSGIGRFRDGRRHMLKRYLPNVGKDKNRFAVDSWYLYYPLINLGRMANAGNAEAKRLFTSSLTFGIAAARHFEYAWPIQFDWRDYSVIVAAREDDPFGQTDVGGLYAALMLEAFALTDHAAYLAEARAAIDAAIGMRFELGYQTNLTAWGAAACMRLWRIANQRHYLDQCYVYLASFLHNCVLWQSRIGCAQHHDLFFQPTCLHDARYCAIFEAYDSFVAFERLLKDGGPDFDEGARMLVSQYCRYALANCWNYYPDALPAEILAKDIRNGRIDRDLSFPLEDLYPDGQPPGQVGQEIYGAGAALVFASKAFHRIPGAPFLLFCDHFVLDLARSSERSLEIWIDGGSRANAMVAIVPAEGGDISACKLRYREGRQIRSRAGADGARLFDVEAHGAYALSW